MKTHKGRARSTRRQFYFSDKMRKFAMRVKRSIQPAVQNREQFDMIESYITHDIHNAVKRHRAKTALVKMAC